MHPVMALLSPVHGCTNRRKGKTQVRKNAGKIRQMSLSCHLVDLVDEKDEERSDAYLQ